MRDIEALVKEMTTEEKCSLLSGLDMWHTKPVGRLGIPSVMVSDGPNGLRKQAEKGDIIGINSAVTAVCFPTGSAVASTFDRKLLRSLGSALGTAARAEGVHTLLGPAINMKRSPLCGRNFEYMSEDPYLAGELAAEYTLGVQSHGVGVSVKHFAANNQEYSRMSTDTIVSERALREIYLCAFERVVKKASPWTVMCSYNRINGKYSSENRWLLTDVLRSEWGFDGIVMTDWSAINHRDEALEAGLELEMPSSYGIRDRQIVKAVKEGKVKEEVLDEAVRRLLSWIFRDSSDSNPVTYSLDEHHEMAKRIAWEAAVLLKNNNASLPLKDDEKVLFVGSYAKHARYQGGGSSHVSSYKVTSFLDGLDVPFEMGWSEDGFTRDADALDRVIAKAGKYDKTVIFAGLPDSYESEGVDRKHMMLPPCQDELISEVTKVCDSVIVVLSSGSPVTMPWAEDVSSILQLHLGGEASGEACRDIIYGKVNPSGHLAETYPLRLEDNPSYLSFPGSGKKVVYIK